MTVREYRERLARKRALAMGISIEEFEARVAAEYARIERIRELTYNRELQHDVLAGKAAAHGRVLVRGGL